jgi:hypothetical protein
VFLVFRGFVDEVFDGLIVVLEPVPEGVDFFHSEESLKFQVFDFYFFFFALPKKETKNASPGLFADPLFSQF